MGRLAAVLCAVCLTLAANSSTGQDRDRIAIGNWRGGAQTNENGEYRFCSAGALPSTGTNIILYWRESGFSFSLYNDNWELPAGTSYSVFAAIDGRWGRDVTGDAYSTTAINFRLGHDVDAVEAFRLGNQLTINAADETFRFDLNGTNATIQALQECHARNLAARPGEDTRTPPGRRPESEYRSLAEPNVPLDLLRSLFADNISVPTKVIVPPDGLSHYQFVAPGSPGSIQGSYVEMDPRTSSTEDMLEDHLEISRLLCPGRFASDTEPAVSFGSSVMLRAITICETSDGPLYENFTLLNLQVFAQLFHISSDDAGLETASQIGDDLYGMLERFSFFLTQSE